MANWFRLQLISEHLAGADLQTVLLASANPESGMLVPCRKVPLMKHRPKVELLAPAKVLTGQSFSGVVRILVKRPTQIRGLWVELVGQEEVQFGSGQLATKTKVQLQVESSILGPSTLAAGLHEHRFHLPVPEHCSPSYTGQRCGTRYVLKLHLGIPWWMDRRTDYDILVGQGTPMATYPGNAVLFKSEEGGPGATRPYLEGSVAGDVLVPGEILQGAFALLNTQYNRYTRVTIALVGTEVLHYRGRQEDREVRRMRLEIATDSPGEGESFRIGFRVPSNLAASMSADLWSLGWHLEVVAQVRLGRSVRARLPIVVVPGRFQERGLVHPSAPRVGSERLRAIWSSVAQELELESTGTQLHGGVGEVELTILRQHLGRRGWALVAEIDYPSFRMGAQVQKASLLRGTAFGGVSTGSKALDKTHHSSADRLAQAQAFFAKLGPALTPFDEVELSDRHAKVQIRERGSRRGRLLKFSEGAKALATSLEQVRQHIPPPAEFASHLQAWTELAHELGGVLERGDLSIRGRYQGIAVEVEHRRSAEGTLSESSLRLSELSRIAEREVFTLEASARDTFLAETGLLDSEQQTLLKPVLQEALFFTQAVDEVCLTLPPVVHPLRISQVLPVLVAFARTRSESLGPYR